MEHYLFGENTQSEGWFQRVNDVFRNLVACPADIDLHNIHEMFVEGIKISCDVEKPNVVILEAGDKPSFDQNILSTILRA